MSRTISIKKGLNIPLQGIANELITDHLSIRKFAIDPADFRFVIPKMLVKVGDNVEAGSPLFYDKLHENHIIVSPISGIVTDILRGEKRKILSIAIDSDEKNKSKHFEKVSLATLTRDDLTKILLETGLWSFIKQRPFNSIANEKLTPKAIFISCFNTAPLAPKFAFILKDNETAFATGIEMLRRYTNGKIHLNVDANEPVNPTLSMLKGVEINQFSGKHPAGNVGVQIHHLDPINKGDIVWTIAPEDLIIIGRFFEHGVIDMRKTVAITGSELTKPYYTQIPIGAEITPLLEGNLKFENNRYISGNVLTGKQITKDGFLGYYHNQLTVIPEGKHHEFLGWASLGADKYSFSKTFLAKLLPKKEYRLDSNIHGGERAYVITGEFEKVLPMDIYPMQLIKAILAEDIDMMESLGIYEVDNEDFALCEYICTSKTNIQDIITNGIELMRKEMS